ncbi:MAG: phosphatidylserine/phosphatidylglycerophosphate/cardiolipin synthase family protein [Myxococcaceae bacterium]|nr:phosphatidylserine/phosphatidylglycerophosphate/cardiolipin synthase family protein [Myxococcaceae bacterium]
MLDAIGKATSTVCLETYILKDDATGRRFLDALKARARAGVEVLLLYDDWGSTVSDEALGALAEAGVKVLPFLPARVSLGLKLVLARLRRRNHRKSLVVDGWVGFTGGLNVSDEYASTEDGGEGWRDTHLRLEGPGALELERLFLATWRRQRGPRFDEARFARGRHVACGQLSVVGNEFGLHQKAIRKAYVDAIGKATSRIFLTHAYFLPPRRLLKELTRAVRRGVRVAVIVAATTDVKLVLWGARGLYLKLLKSGVEVYEWQGRVLHAKTAVVDGTWATVGSSNLDALSLRQNLEVNAVVVDRRFGLAMEQLFLEDLLHCTRITRETVKGYGVWRRALSWFAWQLRHWL